MVRSAMLLDDQADPCVSQTATTARLPAAPNFANEQAYFEYLGARVTPMASAAPRLATIHVLGERVYFLSEPGDYQLDRDGSLTGAVATLCQLGRRQRIILQHDSRWTYLVESKELLDARTVRIRVRRGRPITDINVVRRLLGRG